MATFGWSARNLSATMAANSSAKLIVYFIFKGTKFDNSTPSSE